MKKLFRNEIIHQVPIRDLIKLRPIRDKFFYELRAPIGRITNVTQSALKQEREKKE